MGIALSTKQAILRAIHSRRRKRWRRTTAAILAESGSLRSASDRDLARRAGELAWKAQCAVSLASLLTPAYALVREASRRAHGQSHYDVQVLAGIALYDGSVAQMQTGEGKTLAGLLPAFLYSLARRGCHVVTANDYLAARDAEFAEQVMTRLGISVGRLQESLDRDARRSQYACDITYGTAREFGFDFLRDRLASQQGDPPVQRSHYFALVDEADNVLIDDARTPLIIASADERSRWGTLAAWCHSASRILEANVDFRLDSKSRRARLTKAGCFRLLRRDKSPDVSAFDLERIYRQTEHALVATHILSEDRDYVASQSGIDIIDPSTGRVAEGRKWQDGLHQAVEAKEGLRVSENAQVAARITVQSYFRRYRHLSGLTGTANEAFDEFRRVYGLGFVDIPTRLPGQRVSYPTRVFQSLAAKHRAVVEEVRMRRSNGQAVLVGTPSVVASEALSRVLCDEGIPHEVLNCRQHARESEIISEAGRPGRVTIATNMAGRGTDIRLSGEVRQAGGLHIIATEHHAHQRIDRQLIGRAARQGDPGSYQFLLSLEDELLREAGADCNTLQNRAKADKHGELPASWESPFRHAQATLNRQHTRQRKDLLEQEQRRNKMCRAIGLDPFIEMVAD